MTEPLQIKWKLFIPWLKSKPAKRRYRYCDIYNCLVCKFVKETHGETIVAGAYTIRRSSEGRRVPIPAEISRAIVENPYTIAGVLARLEQ